ncbi:hypothetical protein APHAL10511_002592 [Amanita phalloides]|nr:hypothetical protein APHAL10511_002592 [Amanita phalloides]
MDPPRRLYSAEEKLHLLANLDLEVAHRTRQLEAWLADRLENFNIHQQGQISRIPIQVRTMTVRQFGEKYNGNIQDALRGVQRERMAAAGLDANAEIDKSERKRKWVASQEVESGPLASGSRKDPTESRSVKNARLMPATSPKKPPPSIGYGNFQRSRLLTSNKTPATPRTISRIPPSPSPQKLRPPFVTGMSSRPSRPTSPTKHPASRQTTNRVPSSSTFNPALPPKTPSYPASAPKGVPKSAALRLPRKDESMLSVNGSPLANPYQFGLGWFRGVEMGQDVDTDESTAAGQTRKLKRTKSNIIVRRDPCDYSGTESQPSHYATPEGTSINHSREQSQSSHPYSSKPPSYSSQFPHPQTFLEVQATPKTIPDHTRSFSALVAIPTKDGHLLEFDPLQTSPGALEALDGISDSAKKQARLEMGRLVQTAVEKWKMS